MPTKVTLLFRLGTSRPNGDPSRIAGYSESHYHPDAYDSESAIHAQTNTLKNKRAGLLPIGSGILGHRFTALDDNLVPTGRSRTYDQYKPGVAGIENDVPQASLKVTLRAPAPAPNRKEHVLRGIPDARIVRGEYMPSNAYQQALIDYFKELCLNWKFRGLDTTAVKLPLESIGRLGNVTTSNNAAYAAGMRVQLFRCRASTPDVKNPFGEYTLRLRTGGENAGLYLEGWASLATVALASGWLKQLKFKLHSMEYDEQEIIDPTACVKKVGKAFFQYAGRRGRKRR